MPCGAITRVVLLCVLLSTGVTRAAEQSNGAGRVIRRSDVVFMYDNPSRYEEYGCTVLGWAGSGNAERIEAAHQNGIRQFATSVGFLTEFNRVIDFDENFLDAACRDFTGKTFVVPWLWDHKHQHKGQPAWWWCTNSPLYRRYLDSRLKQVAEAGPDGLHIDDYRGTSGSITWLSGGFCRHCMAGFREYLAKKVPKEKLQELGVEDLSKFDYRQFLLDQGVKPEEYNGRRSSLPLAAEFYDFQVTGNTAYIAEYRRRAEQLRGKPMSLCVNSGLSNPQALAIAPQLSYFCCEVGHHASSRAVPEHPIYIYKLADGLNRPVTSTASGQDWAYIMENELPGLVRTWTALSYAHGHTLMAPHRQWCYTKEKGTHWYDGPTEEYAWLYRFVRSQQRLLDGYEAVAPIAVVYDNATRRLGRGDIEPICKALAQRNLPFTVVVAGDDWLDYRLDADRLKGFQAVIVTDKLAMQGSQREAVEQVRTDGRLVVWPNDELLEKLAGAPIVTEGSTQISVVARANPRNTSAPLVVHLLNRAYDKQQDTMVPQENFTLKLRHDLGKFTAATLHAPKQEPLELTIEHADDYLTIKIPRLELWGLVEMKL